MPKLGYKQTEKHKKAIRKNSNPKKISDSLKKFYSNKDNKNKMIKNVIKGLKKSRHHLDLNDKNNKQNNIYILTNRNHQRFHRLAYHYLLMKYGIKEILKYKKWFEKYKIQKEE
jgi:hypothetical protein